MTILRDDMRRTNSEKTSKNVLLVGFIISILSLSLILLFSLIFNQGEELTALQQQAQHLQTQLKESMNQVRTSSLL